MYFYITEKDIAGSSFKILGEVNNCELKELSFRYEHKDNKVNNNAYIIPEIMRRMDIGFINLKYYVISKINNRILYASNVYKFDLNDKKIIKGCTPRYDFFFDSTNITFCEDLDPLKLLFEME